MRIGSLVAKGVATFETGLVGTPSITFDGSLTTGFFVPGTDQLAIAVGGANVFEFATNGKLTLTTGYDGLIPAAGVGGDDNAAVSIKWVEDNFTFSTGTGTIGLNDLDDVDVTKNAGPNVGDYLSYNASGDWENRSESEVKADLNLEIGTDVQAWDTDLDDIAALDPSQNDNFMVSDGANWTQETPAQARTTLGLDAGGAGDIWVEKAGDTMDSGADIGFVGGGEVTGLPSVPTSSDAAASKAYVDSQSVGLTWVNPVYYIDFLGDGQGGSPTKDLQTPANDTNAFITSIEDSDMVVANTNGTWTAVGSTGNTVTTDVQAGDVLRWEQNGGVDPLWTLRGNIGASDIWSDDEIAGHQSAEVRWGTQVDTGASPGGFLSGYTTPIVELVLGDESGHTLEVVATTSANGVTTDAAVGTSGFTINVTQQGTAGLPEITQIIPVDASSLAQSGTGSYFTIYSAADATQYDFWFDVDGGNSAPAAGGTNIEVDVTATDSSSVVADSLRRVMIHATGPDTDFTTNAEYDALWGVTEDNATLSVMDVTTASGASVTAGDYFTYYSATGNDTLGFPDPTNATAHSGTTFYIWYEVDASSGNDPAPGGHIEGVQVDILSGDTANQVATKTVAAMDLHRLQQAGSESGEPTLWVVSDQTGVVRITEKHAGRVAVPVTGTGLTGWTYGEQTQGVYNGMANSTAFFVSNTDSQNYGTQWVYTTTTDDWTLFGGQLAILPGVGLSQNGQFFDVNLGPGLFENPSDQVALELYDETTGAIILTKDGTSRQEDDVDSRLHLLINGSTLTQGASGISVPSQGITETELHTSVAGDGISGGNGTALAVDGGNGITISANQAVVDATSTFTFSTGQLEIAPGGVDDAMLALDYVEVAGDTMTGDLTMDTGTQIFIAGDGTATDPGLAVSGDTNTGLYSVGTDQLGVTVGGTLRATFNTTDLTMTVPVLNAAGLVGAPSVSFSGDTDTGMWSSAGDTIDFSTGGVARFQIEPNGTLNVAGTSNYETLVTNDDDIPNLKKVNDLISAVSTTSIIDADLDTKVDVEEGGDDDTIRMDAGETPSGYGAVPNIFLLNSAGWTVGMGTANVATTVGAPISVTAGTGNTTGAGGAVTVTAGQGGATGTGGAAKIYGGAGGATSGGGGVAGLYGGDATTSGAGGDANVYAGTGLSVGGTARLKAGASTGSDTGGGVAITAGAGGASAGIGGAVDIISGAGYTTSAGGTVNISSGAAGATGDGGPINITSSKGGTTNAHQGGRIDLQAGRDGLNSSRGAYMHLDGGGTDGAGQGGDVDLKGGLAPTQGGHVNLYSGNILGGGPGGAVVRLDGATTSAGARLVMGGGNYTAGQAGHILIIPGQGSSDGTKGWVEIQAPDTTQSPLLRLSKSNGGNYIGLTMDTSITANTTYTLPEAPAGNGYALVSTTAGIMSWLDLGTGLDNSKITDGDSTTAETYIDTDENTDTINSQIGVTGAYPAFEPLNISAGATGTVIKAASATSGTNAGRPVTIESGAAYGATTGGNVTVTTGAGSPGGDFKVYGGYNNGGGSGNGGSIYMKAGDHPSSMGAAGDIKIYGGVEVGEYSPAELVFSAGTVNLKASYGLASDNVGDFVLIKGGNSFGDGNSGNVRVYAGSAPGAGDGGVVQIKAGDSASGAVGWITLDTADTAAAVNLRFMQASGGGSNWIALKAPNGVSTTRVWTLPQNADSAGDVLSTDGSGNMAWNDIGTLAGTYLTLDNISDVDDIVAHTNQDVAVLVGDGTNWETQNLIGGTNLTAVVDQGADTVTLNVDDAFIANQGGDQFGDTGSGTWTVASGSTLSIATGATMTLIDAPTASTDAVNKAYADSISAGLDPKESVRVATTADLTGVTWGSPSYNYTAGTGGTGAFVDINLSAAVDGVTLAINDRVLVKDQSVAKQNGIYVVKTGTSFPTQALLERAEDHDSPSIIPPPSDPKVSGGNFTFIENGTYQDTGWVLTGDGVLNLSTTGSNGDDLNWTQFTGAGSFTAGIGLSQSGNTLDLDVDDLVVATIVSADTIAFHDADGTPASSGSITRKTTAANFISDLNILTGTVGGSLTASDGVLITASDVIELDITNLGAATIVGADELVFDDGASGNHAKTTVTNFLNDLDIVNLGAFSSAGILARTADDTYAEVTLTAATTGLEGIDIQNGDGSGTPTIGLDIDNLSDGGQPGDTEKLVVFDGTNNVTTTVNNLATAIAATTNIGDLGDVTADSSSDAAGNVLVADGTDSYDTQKIQHIESVTGQTNVTVNHSIGQKFVIVQCYDSSDQMVVPQSVTLTDANNTAVVFSPAFTGNIVVMGIPGVV